MTVGAVGDPLHRKPILLLFQKQYFFARALINKEPRTRRDEIVSGES